MDIPMESGWKQLLQSEFEKKYFIDLMSFLDREKEEYPNSIFPAEDQIFRSLNECSIDKVKVVIIGQDPYPTKGHANGLAFSVNPDVSPLPKSLKNIFLELKSDISVSEPKNGDLSHWAKQGVVLLNTSLTVREGEADSHKGRGWELFTDHILEILNENCKGIVYMLWGKNAQSKSMIIDEQANLVLCAPHPSPLSAYRGFFECRHFSKANHYLEKLGKPTINW